ncbi:MAG: hypothetical protein ACRCZZ_04825 [Phocaeicola sp.]
MKRAHNLYKNARAKYPTFGAALAKSWKMAKFSVATSKAIVKIDAERAEEAATQEIAREEAAIKHTIAIAQIKAQSIVADAKAKAEKMRDRLTAKKMGISYESYREQISTAMGYGRGAYCGD